MQKIWEIIIWLCESISAAALTGTWKTARNSKKTLIRIEKNLLWEKLKLWMWIDVVYPYSDRERY